MQASHGHHDNEMIEQAQASGTIVKSIRKANSLLLWIMMNLHSTQTISVKSIPSRALQSPIHLSICCRQLPTYNPTCSNTLLPYTILFEITHRTQCSTPRYLSCSSPLLGLSKQFQPQSRPWGVEPEELVSVSITNSLHID